MISSRFVASHQDAERSRRFTSRRWSCGPTTTRTRSGPETPVRHWEPNASHGVRSAEERHPPCTGRRRRCARRARSKGVEFAGDTLDTGGATCVSSGSRGRPDAAQPHAPLDERVGYDAPCHDVVHPLAIASCIASAGHGRERVGDA